MPKIHKKTWLYCVILLILALAMVLLQENDAVTDPAPSSPSAQITLDDIPAYSGNAYVELNENMPLFDEEDLESEPFETYSPLDSLGRCGAVYACAAQELMPTSERESISEVRPSGWRSVRYSFIDGESLYNRCHLIGFMLTGENANERNLITGTRYMNTEGMLPFEESVANYIRRTGNRVLYRVTPMFDGEDLLAAGVRMEAYSIEDNGEGICFHVFCYNVQPGIVIDYADGENREEEFLCNHKSVDLVINTSSMKYHLASCPGAVEMNPKNRKDVSCCPEELEAKGYTPCGSCDPDKIIE